MSSPPQSHKKFDAGRIGGPVVIPNCIQVRLAWLLPGTTASIAYNILHATVPPSFALTPAIVTAVANAIYTVYTSNLALYQPSNSQLGGVDMKDLRVANSPVVSPTAGGPLGTSASPAMPFNVAAVLTERTAQAGRAFRGRIYIPNWATNADSGNGSIAAALVTALGGFGNALLSSMAGQGMTTALAQPARQSYIGYTGTLHAARAANAVPLTQIVVRNSHWDTQRRRGQP